MTYLIIYFGGCMIAYGILEKCDPQAGKVWYFIHSTFSWIIVLPCIGNLIGLRLKEKESE